MNDLDARRWVRLFDFKLLGEPVPQGNHAGGWHGRIYDKASDELEAWRGQLILVTKVFARRLIVPLDEDVKVEAMFLMPRPKRSRFISAPLGPPDVDKMQRAIGDALVLAKLIVDDARIVRWEAEKTWAYDAPGAHIAISTRASGPHIAAIRAREEQMLAGSLPDIEGVPA